MVGFLKNLFAPRPMSNRYITLYIQPKACKEVLEVRIDTMNEPSLQDDGTYYVRKLARGQRCPFGVEVEMTFAKNRAITQKIIINGEETTQEAYQAFLDTQTPA